MSIEREIERIIDAKQTLHEWITSQGITTPENPLLTDLVALLPLVDNSSYTGCKMLTGTSSVISGEVVVPGVVVDERDITDGFYGAIAFCDGTPITMLCLNSQYGQTTNSSYTINIATTAVCARFSDYKFYWCVDPDMTAFTEDSQLTIVSFWRS